MNWADLFSCEPLWREGQIPVFGREEDGDCFDEADVAEWRGGKLLSNWTKRTLLDNPAMHRLLDKIAKDERCVIDLAAGPGLGLLPSLNQLHPGLQAMAVDANLPVLREWQHVLNGLGADNIALAQCSLMALPFKSGAVRAYTSMIGLSSTRGGEEGVMTALAEVYRTLMPGGKLYAIEAEWTDVQIILSLFEKMGQQPWDVFRQAQSTWHERFIRAGFTVLQEQEAECCFLCPEDNDLGEAAAIHGVQVGQRRKTYILQK